MLTLSEILENALALPPHERVRLIDDLLHSIDQAERGAIDAAWGNEVEARIDAHARGEIRAIDEADAWRSR